MVASFALGPVKPKPVAPVFAKPAPIVPVTAILPSVSPKRVVSPGNVTPPSLMVLSPIQSPRESSVVSSVPGLSVDTAGIRRAKVSGPLPALSVDTSGVPVVPVPVFLVEKSVPPVESG